MRQRRRSTDRSDGRQVPSTDWGTMKQHLAYLRHIGRRPGTIEQRRWCIERLRRFVSPTPLLDSTPEQLYAFCSQEHLGAEARAAAVSHLRSFFRWCLREGHIVLDPSVRLDRPRRPKHLPRPMPEEVLERALREAPRPISAWLHLAAYAGLRCCEIAPLRGEDRHGDVLIIRGQKGGDEGTVPISAVLDRQLFALPSRGPWFPRWDGQPGSISAGQLQRHANRWLHDQGISHTMHTARHRFGTMVYQASGRDLRATQELLRHRSIASTVGYTWIDPGQHHGIVGRL